MLVRSWETNAKPDHWETNITLHLESTKFLFSFRSSSPPQLSKTFVERKTKPKHSSPLVCGPLSTKTLCWRALIPPPEQYQYTEGTPWRAFKSTSKDMGSLDNRRMPKPRILVKPKTTRLKQKLNPSFKFSMLKKSKGKYYASMLLFLSLTFQLPAGHTPKMQS